MTRSELISLLAEQFDQLTQRDIKLAVEQITDAMAEALAQQQRVEVRGFGSFSITVRPPRMGRNPRTGESVAIAEQRVPHFKPGKALRDAVAPIAKKKTTR
ncbi:MAG: integration host factor subunit beta [Ottowia sp.]|nr:integration host factor subunit beta [Ottowia sp.]